MTTIRIGRWLLVVLAVVGLAVVAPVVSAHGNGPTADDAPPYDGTAADWAAWMEAQMTEHMGPGAVEWMEAHTGVTVEEMARDVADDDHMAGGDDHGRYGQGRGC